MIDCLYVNQWDSKLDRDVWLECPVIRETKTHVLVVNPFKTFSKRGIWFHKETLEEIGRAYNETTRKWFCTQKYLDDLEKPKATRDEILKEFREKAKIHHPDKGGDPAEFQRLVEARDRALRTATDA